MSYDFYIGELVIGDDDDLDIRALALPEAPLFPHDEMTGRGNHRHPGYGQWGEFVSAVGLEELSTELIPTHPGHVRLTPKHLAQVRAALKKWRAKRWPVAERIVGWPDGTWEKPVPESEQEKYDPHQARLMWLEWWIEWALRTCTRPTFLNR